LPSAEPERVVAEIEEVIGIPADEALMISAKPAWGVMMSWSNWLVKFSTAGQHRRSFASINH